MVPSGDTGSVLGLPLLGPRDCCPSCGYSLETRPEAGVCPECGLGYTRASVFRAEPAPPTMVLLVKLGWPTAALAACVAALSFKVRPGSAEVLLFLLVCAALVLVMGIMTPIHVRRLARRHLSPSARRGGFIACAWRLGMPVFLVTIVNTGLLLAAFVGFGACVLAFQIRW